MTLNNQRGAIELSTLSLLIIVSLLFLTHLLIQSTLYRRLDQHLDQLTCLKEVIGVTQEHIYKIGKLNQLIRLAQKTQVATIIIPGLQAGTMKIQEAKKLIKYTQYFIHLSYLKNLATLQTQSCHVPLILYKTPYVIDGIDLKRSADELAEITSQEWEIITRTPIMKFFSHFTLESALSLKPKLEVQ